MTIPRKTFRLWVRLISLVVTIICAYLANYLFAKNSYGFAIIPTMIGLIAGLVDVYFGDKITEAKYPADTEKRLKSIKERREGVQTALVDILKELNKSLKGCNRDEISTTVHICVNFYSALDDGEEQGFVQLIDYAGKYGGNSLRITPSTKGIIGRALRSQKSEFVNFLTLSEYTERMVKEFGFTKAEAESKTSEARSYYAAPILDSHVIVGILYLFSTEPQVFPKANVGKVIEQKATEISHVLKAGNIV